MTALRASVPCARVAGFETNRPLPGNASELAGIDPLATALARHLGFKTTWVVAAVKRANKVLATQGKETLIFTGRYSTPAKVLHWIETHTDFVARHVLVSPERELVYRQRQYERRRKRKGGGS